MPFALFCQDAKISKAFPTATDVWRHASDNGLVVDIESDDESAIPERTLDNDYEIRACEADAPEMQGDQRMTAVQRSDPT